MIIRKGYFARVCCCVKLVKRIGVLRWEFQSRYPSGYLQHALKESGIRENKIKTLKRKI
jgi:hypothetical protein